MCSDNGGAALCIDRAVKIEAEVPGSVVLDGGGERRVISVSSRGDATLVGLTITGGYTTDDGGAISVYGGSAALHTCTLASNKAEEWGGAISNTDSGRMELHNCAIATNEAGRWGGAIYNYNSTMEMHNCTIATNEALWGGAISNQEGRMELHNCTIATNKADFGGGGIFNVRGAMKLRKCKLATNKAAQTEGGAISNHQGTMELHACTLTTNKAGNQVIQNDHDFGTGGAIYNEAGTMELHNCELATNEAMGNGGVIYQMALATGGRNEAGLKRLQGGIMRLHTCTLASNRAYQGGAISNGRFCQLSVSNTFLIDNEAANDCGAISNHGMVELHNSTLTTNKAKQDGGAICHDGRLSGSGTMKLQTTILTDNEAASAGGAISNFGTMELHKCTLATNKAGGDGGAIRNGQAGTMKLLTCTLATNEAGDAGGAIYNDGITMELLSTLLIDNQAGDVGSSALHASNGKVRLGDGTRFVNNGFRVGLAEVIYVLPAPPGHYTNARKCEVVYAACPTSCSACMEDKSLYPAATSDDSCTLPPYIIQPCPWNANLTSNAFGPEIIGLHLERILPGTHNQPVWPVPCSPGLLGATANETDGQQTASCLGLCPAGYYCPEHAMTEPIQCPISSFCVAGSSAPTACKEGTLGLREGLASDQDCEPCPKGSWCSAGKAVECPMNTYQPDINQDYAGACQQCPENAVAESGSTSRSACTCVEHYYNAFEGPGGVKCQPCPFGSECEGPGNTLAALPLRPGYWRSHGSSADVRRCPDASSPDTTACANANGFVCKQWTSGPYCRLCNVTDGSRWYDSRQSACVPCGDKAATALATLMGTAAALLLLLCWFSMGQPFRLLRKIANQVFRMIRAPLKQMIAFYQVATRVESVFGVSMPTSVAALLEVFDVLNLNVDAFGLPMSCLKLGTFFSQLLFLVMVPVVLGLLILACSMAAEVLSKRKAATPKAVVIRALPYLLILAFLAFPMVSSRAFQAFDCEEFDGGASFLRADYALDCDGEEYDRVVSLAWLAIVLYPICIPLAGLALLLTARKAILAQQPTALSRGLAFLHHDYKPSMYWWETVETGKKLFLVGFCVLIRPGSIVQLIVGFIFALVILLFSSLAEPFQRRGHDYFSLLCNFSLVAVLFFSLVLKVGVLAEDVEESDLLSEEVHSSYTFNAGQLSVAMILTLLSSLVVASALAVYQLCRFSRAAARSAAAEREASIARGRLSHPPACDWKLREGNRYCMFLSHYKVEAGSDARYLSDLIQRKTGCTAYLDSNDLCDLRTLFNEGVHKSDVLVILATKGVFTRPWCLMEMWEAAVNQIPVILFPVVGGNWSKEDACTLLSDLMEQMPGRNPACMGEVMAHVGTQGVTDVREVEDVLLSHIGLVPSVLRSGRPASRELDLRLCSHLKRNVEDMPTWLRAHHDAVEQNLSLISWQPWAPDNQIIASVQLLVDACAVALGRAQPEWKDTWPANGELSQGLGELSQGLGELSQGVKRRLLRRVSRKWHAPCDAKGRLLIICALNECGGPARLLQRQFSDKLQGEVVISSEHIDTWRGEVESAARGVVVLQTSSVLRHPVRLLQIFEAVQLRRPLVCVNVEGGGYDFAKVKPLLHSLSNELPLGEMMTLQSELIELDSGFGQLASSLSDAVPNAISVFFNPAAGDKMMEAATKEILQKLERVAELLNSEAISVTPLQSVSVAISVNALARKWQHRAAACRGSAGGEKDANLPDDLCTSPTKHQLTTLAE